MLEKIRNNNYSGFVFETITGFVMHYLPDTPDKLFSFIKSLEEIDRTVKINVSQNTEKFKVDLVPRSMERMFNERIEKSAN